MEEVAAREGLAAAPLEVLREDPDMRPRRSCPNSILRRRTPSSIRRRLRKRCSRELHNTLPKAMVLRANLSLLLPWWRKHTTSLLHSSIAFPAKRLTV
jgi:hypothetical protein